VASVGREDQGGGAELRRSVHLGSLGQQALDAFEISLDRGLSQRLVERGERGERGMVDSGGFRGRGCGGHGPGGKAKHESDTGQRNDSNLHRGSPVLQQAALHQAVLHPAPERAVGSLSLI